MLDNAYKHLSKDKNDSKLQQTPVSSKKDCCLRGDCSKTNKCGCKK